LLGGALYVPEGAKNAAVAFIGPQDGMATGAFVEELAGVRWHFKVFREAALGAG
jgi:hypothetical protein